MKEVVSAVEREDVALEKERQAWMAEMRLSLPKLQGRIQLDVGGARFFASRATLTARPGFFQALCGGVAPVELDQDGCIFIDRDATAFRFVLLFLQGQAIAWDTLSKSEVETLALDAEYYELEELVDAVKGGNAKEASQKHVWIDPPTESVLTASVVAVAAGAPTRHAQLGAFEKELASALLVWKEKRAELEKEKANFARLREKLLSCVCGEKIKLQLMNANVRFCTTIRTLTSKPESFFAAKFGSADRWKGDLDADGSVFIERDDCAFRHTLNHLRGYPPPHHLSRAEEVALRADKDYYQRDMLYVDALEGSFLLRGLSAANRRKVAGWLPKGTPRLLYSASRDGWDGAVFHKLCDSAARSIVFCQSSAGDTWRICRCSLGQSCWCD